MNRTKFSFHVQGKDVKIGLIIGAYSNSVTTNFDTAFGEEWSADYIDQVEDMLLTLTEILDLRDTDRAKMCLHDFVDRAFSEDYTTQEDADTL